MNFITTNRPVISIVILSLIAAVSLFQSRGTQKDLAKLEEYQRGVEGFKMIAGDRWEGSRESKRAAKELKRKVDKVNPHRVIYAGATAAVIGLQTISPVGIMTAVVLGASTVSALQSKTVKLFGQFVPRSTLLCLLGIAILVGGIVYRSRFHMSTSVERDDE